MKYTYATSAILLCLALLSGCATRPALEEAIAYEPWMARKVALSHLQDWVIGGRIGVTTAKEGWHASLHWTQQGQNYLIDLIGPLGQGRMRIQGNESRVIVQTADGRVLSAADPERLLKETVGVGVPVSGLQYWVRGLPAPIPHSELRGDEQGRLTHLEQGGWVIDYSDYEPVAGLDLPTRIRARQGDLQVQLVIRQWNPAS